MNERTGSRLRYGLAALVVGGGVALSNGAMRQSIADWFGVEESSLPTQDDVLKVANDTLPPGFLQENTPPIVWRFIAPPPAEAAPYIPSPFVPEPEPPAPPPAPEPEPRVVRREPRREPEPSPPVIAPEPPQKGKKPHPVTPVKKGHRK